MLDRWRTRWPWLDAVLRVNDRFGAVGGGALASSIALSTFLSLFPLLLVAIAVLGFVSFGDAGFASRLVDDLGLQGRSAEMVLETLDTAAESRRAASLVGLAGLAWSGLGVVGSLQAALNAVWQEQGRGMLGRLVAIRWLGGAALLFLATAALGPIGRFLPGWATPLLVVVGLGLSSVLFTWTYTTLGNTHAGWRAHVVGGVLVAVGFEVLKFVGSFYLPRVVASSSALYGSLGMVFAILAWLAIYGRLLVYGAVVNVVRWETAHGTDDVVLQVPRHLGAGPLTANRRGGVDEHEPGHDPDAVDGADDDVNGEDVPA